MRCAAQIRSAFGRRTSVASLSSLSPRYDTCRNRPSAVHVRNFTCATSFGFTHFTCNRPAASRTVLTAAEACRAAQTAVVVVLRQQQGAQIDHDAITI
jgi:hypothetical protein